MAGGRFGNELFIAAVSLITAARASLPVLLRRPGCDVSGFTASIGSLGLA